jgi:hypothetical protein
MLARGGGGRKETRVSTSLKLCLFVVCACSRLPAQDLNKLMPITQSADWQVVCQQRHQIGLLLGGKQLLRRDVLRQPQLRPSTQRGRPVRVLGSRWRCADVQS